MAKLRDAVFIVRDVGIVPFVRKVWSEISDDNLFTWASALAYSWLFAIFPFFLVLLSMLPLLRPEWKLEASHQIDNTLRELPREAQITLRQYLKPRLDALLFEPPRGITGIWSLGLLITIWAASGGMAMTMSALDKCWDVPRTRPIWKQRPLAVGLTLVVATSIVIVIILIPVGTMVINELTSSTDRLLRLAPAAHPASSQQTPAQVAATAPATGPASKPFAAASDAIHAPHRFAAFIVIWQVARYGVALLLLFGVVALVYHFGPNMRHRFRALTPGTLFTVGAWLSLGTLFRGYVDHFGKYGQTYGAVGGVIILLFFFYLDALVMLIGAEIDSEIDCAVRNAACHRDKPPPPDVPGGEPVPESP